MKIVDNKEGKWFLNLCEKVSVLFAEKAAHIANAIFSSTFNDYGLLDSNAKVKLDELINMLVLKNGSLVLKKSKDDFSFATKLVILDIGTEIKRVVNEQVICNRLKIYWKVGYPVNAISCRAKQQIVLFSVEGSVLDGVEWKVSMPAKNGDDEIKVVFEQDYWGKETFEILKKKIEWEKVK